MGCVIIQLIMITIYCWPWIAWYKVLFMNVQPVKKWYYNSLDTEHRTFRCTHMSMKQMFFFHTGSIWPSFICLWWWRWKFIWYWKFWWSCWLHWIWCYQCTSAKGPSECCCQEYIGKKTAQYIIFHLLLQGELWDTGYLGWNYSLLYIVKKIYTYPSFIGLG